MDKIPALMQVVVFDEPGGPDVLHPAERAVPEPGPGEILVRVEAAGVNRPDVLQREGAYPPPPGASDIPGLEIAGTVVAVGKGVSAYALGEKVCALVHGGGYAEYCTVHESNALPIPNGLSVQEAAGIPENFFTVWHNVFQRARLQPGETFLVHGGTSGIGVAAIQLAKAFGATVFATAGSDEKCDACINFGADHAVNYKTADYVEAISTLTNGQGIDVILDMVGGDYAPRNHQLAAMDGRIVQIATLRGAAATVDLSMIMRKRLTHTGSTLRPRTIEFKAVIARELHERVWPLFESGAVKIVLDSTFPLAEAAKAHARMESSAHIGKIILTTG